MRRINKQVEDEIVSMTENSRTSREIAQHLQICHQTVLNVLKRRNIKAPKVTKRRPNLLSDRDARAMERLLTQQVAKTPKEAAQMIQKPVSEWTARRALKKIGLEAAIKPKKPALSDKNVKARLKFCKKYKHWSVDDWKRVIWSDETRINRFQSDGKQYYWHRPHEKLQKHQVKQTMKHGGGSLMVWGCFTWWHIGPMVRIFGIMKKEDYLNILQTNLPDFVDLSAYPTEEVIFQQDGDPKHTAKIVQEWIKNQDFQLLEWPAQSPDLNPIENLWAILKKRLASYEMPPKNIDELWSRVQKEWRDLPNPTIEKLVESMPRRLNSVIKAEGLWTKY